MCRTTDFHHRKNERYPLKIKAFFLNLLVFGSHKPPLLSLPNSLTLVFPRRLNGASLLIDASKIRPDSPGFVTLHRIVSRKAAAADGCVAYASTELIRASEGARFEVYFGEDKVLKGFFIRKHKFAEEEEEEEEEWRMDCNCGLEGDVEAFWSATAMEVLVAVEGQAPMSERVEMTRRKRKARGFRKLEEIPEEREVEEEEEEEDSDDVSVSVSEGGGGCCECWESGSDGGDWEGEMEGGVRRAVVDVGIWAMCLGVGLLVSQASSTSLRRKRFL